MASPLFNKPVQCRKCGRTLPFDKAEGHVCIPKWFVSMMRGSLKAAGTVAFAIMIGYGFGMGMSAALIHYMPTINMRTTIGTCDGGE